MMSEEKAKEDMLLWMDVETTGLDPDHDRILEVEMRCTDMRGGRCVGVFRRVIGLKGRKASVTDGNIKAWRMHCSNGLLFELLNSSFRNDSIGAVAKAVEEYLDSLSQRFTLIPAGTNVDFDMAFLARLNLRPSAWLSYRKFDLTALRRYLTFLQCPEDLYKDHQSPHRVRDCIQRDINDYRRYRELLKGKW